VFRNHRLITKSRRLSQLLLGGFILTASPAKAAFEILVDPADRLVYEGFVPHVVTPVFEFHFYRSDRYGLPELGVNDLYLLGRIEGLPAQAWVAGFEWKGSGDEIYGESRFNAILGKTFNSTAIKFWMGIQSLRIKDYSATTQSFVGAEAIAGDASRLWCEAGFDNLPITSSALYKSDISTVGWFWGGIGGERAKLLFGLNYWESSPVSLIAGVNLTFDPQIRARVFFRDRPDRYGTALNLSIKPYTLIIGYDFQPILGWVRRLGIEATW
jgi:hypothetical protein